MKIALAQTHLTIGDFQFNEKNITEQIEFAIKNNADMIIFPELATTVKGAKDLLCDEKYLQKAEALLKNIAEYTDKITVLTGGTEKKQNTLYNTAFLLQNKTIKSVSIANKIDYDNLKYFTPNKKNDIFEVCGKKFIAVIGNDTTDCSSADYTIRLNSKYYTKNKKIEPEKNTIYVNHTSLADSLIYDGNSFAADENANITALAPKFENTVIIIDTEQKSQPVKMPKTCVEEDIFRALSYGFKEFCRINNFKKAVIGLSGGIDSALTAVIMCNAIGAENVLGITMPSKYSTDGSVNDSYKLAENLGMTCITKPIKALFDTFIKDVQGGQYGDLAEENLQARLRGNILMAYSNRENRVLVSTGNKSEASMGYCTLYGDTCGSINLICDLYKQEVYAVANWINKDKEIIPENTITKAPSAELRPNQKDQDSLPDYAVLDEILYRYTEKAESAEKISKDFDKELVYSIINKFNKMEFKRNQFTLGLKISEKALSERNFPIVNQYKI